MRKSLLNLVILTIIMLLFSGCSINRTGETISAFFNRLNAANEAYDFSPESLIFDKEKNSYSRFVKFNGEDEILLNLELDNRNNLATLNIVTNADSAKNQMAFSFIIDVIEAFCTDESISNSLIDKSDLENSLNKTFYDTKTTEHDGIRIEIDTTELGSVISLHKDI